MGYRIEKEKSISIAAVIVTIVIFPIYLLMLPREYSAANFGSDAGDLLTAVLTGGVAHPSGYPTYLLFGSIVQKLPLASPFFKGALLSAIFSALAVGLLTLLIGQIFLNKEKTPNSFLSTAVISGISFGISPLFWSQAVIVEVYGMATFFIICALLWIFLVSDGVIGKKKDIWISLLSILVGLGFGNHLMIGLMLPAMVYACYLSFKRDNSIHRLINYFLLIVFSTLIIYLLLPLRARSYPPINWGNPQSFDGFFWLVSGRIYQGLAFNISFNEVGPRFLYFLATLRNQFGVAGVFFGIMGIVSLVSSRERMKPVFIWMLLAYLLFSLGYNTDDSIIYLIPFFLIFVILISYGMIEALDLLKEKGYLPGIFLSLAFIVPLFIRVPAIFKEVDPRNEQDARSFALTCLDELPQSAILVTREDKDTMPIWYFHYGMNERQDIHVIVESLLVYDWYRQTLEHIYPDLKLTENTVTIEGFTKENPTYDLCQPIRRIDDVFVTCGCE